MQKIPTNVDLDRGDRVGRRCQTGTPNRPDCALRFSRQSLGNGRLGLKPVVSSWCDTATKSLGCQTGLCTRDLGGRSRNLFALSSLIPHRENSDLAQAGPSTDDNFCGSKAGATFCLAIISIGSGLKPRASQRGRNNCLTLEMENGAPAKFLGEPRTPPPCCVRGRGGMASDLTASN